MLRKAVCVALIGLGAARPATAQSFDRFYGFGDSTIDSGWYRSTPTGDPAIDALLPAALAKGGGEATTNPGLVNSQLLAGFFGLSAIPANQPGGTNYATGGAHNAMVNTAGNVNAVPTVTQIDHYLAASGGTADRNGLYLISSGGNDVTTASGLPASSRNTDVVTAAQALVGGIAQLQAAGGRYIIVPNQPQSLETGTQRSLSGLYNTTLWSGLESAGVSFIPADFNSLLSAVAANPARFGLIAGAGPACSNPGLPGAWAILCTPDSLVSANAAQTHLFADNQHLSTAGQTIEADYYYSLLTAPGEIAMLAETPLLTRTAEITAIENQIPVSQRAGGTLGFNAWVAGGVSGTAFDAGTGFANLTGTPGFATGGLDYRVAPGGLVGVALSGGSQSPHFSLGGGFSQNDISASLYGAFQTGPYWAEAIAGYGTLSDTANRAVPIGITVQQNHGVTSGDDASLALAGGYDFRSGIIRHGPYGGLTVQRVTIDGFTESGGFTSLGFGRQVRNSDVTALGYRASMDWGAWHPFVRAEWDHEFAPLDRDVTASLTTTPAPGYALPAAIFGRDWGTATLGVSIDIAENLVGSLSVSAQAGAAESYGGQIGLSAAF